MASIKYTGIVSEIKGKIAGTVFQQGNRTKIVKSRQNRVTTKTPASLLVQNYKKSYFTQVSQTWRALTDTQRTNWNTAAASFPQTDKFGDVYTPSGYQLFVQFNILRIGTGNDLSAATPTVPTFPVTAGNALQIASGAQTIAIQFSAPVETLFKIEVLCTTAVSPGAMQSRGGFKMMGFSFTDGMGLLDFSGFHAYQFGVIMPLQRYIAKWRYIQIAHGVPSAWQTITDIST